MRALFKTYKLNLVETCGCSSPKMSLIDSFFCPASSKTIWLCARVEIKRMNKPVLKLHMFFIGNLWQDYVTNIMVKCELMCPRNFGSSRNLSLLRVSWNSWNLAKMAFWDPYLVFEAIDLREDDLVRLRKYNRNYIFEKIAISKKKIYSMIVEIKNTFVNLVIFYKSLLFLKRYMFSYLWVNKSFKVFDCLPS